jgi:hypothetical protein
MSKADYNISVPLNAEGSATILVPVQMPSRQIIFAFQSQADLSAAESVLWENCVLDDSMREGHKANDHVYYGVVEALAQLILARTALRAEVSNGRLMFSDGSSMEFVAPDRRQKGRYRATAPADRKLAAEQLVRDALGAEGYKTVADDDVKFYESLNALLSFFTKAAFEIKNA